MSVRTTAEIAAWILSAFGRVDLDDDETETIRAIRRVGGVIGDDKMADECIADLPAESL